MAAEEVGCGGGHHALPITACSVQCVDRQPLVLSCLDGRPDDRQRITRKRPPSGRVFVPIGEVSLRSALLAAAPGDEDTQAVADSLLEEMGDHRGDAFAVHGHAFRAGGLLQRLKQHGQWLLGPL